MNAFIAQLYSLGIEDCDSIINSIESDIKESASNGNTEVEVLIPKTDLEDVSTYQNKVDGISAYFISQKYYSQRKLDENSGKYSLLINWKRI